MGKGKDKGSKRFKFKSFLQRVEEVDIALFRSLDAIKLQPSEGSSFFQESLIQWRELNAAKEFISAYNDIFPLVQTLPQLLLHKTTIVERLLSCLHPSAVLSLDAILSILAVLSRDLGEDFLAFLPRIFDAYATLLQEGGDKNSEIIEMVFTSISFIFKYLSKFLSKDMLFSLKITRRVRFYHEDYIRSFAAEAVSFLMRNASVKETIKGVRKAIGEVEMAPSDSREDKISSCSTLLYHTLKGSADRFHSRAEEILRLLLDPSVIGGVRKDPRRNGSTVLEILKVTFRSLCEGVERTCLHLLWSVLLDELSCSLDLADNESGWSEEQTHRLLQLSSLTSEVVQLRKGSFVNDYKVLFGLSSKLACFALKHHVALSESFVLLLSLIRGCWHALKALPPVDFGVPPWNLAIEYAGAESLLAFVKGFLEEDSELVKPFESLLAGLLDRFALSNTDDALMLLMKLVRRTKPKQLQCTHLACKVFAVIQDSLDKLELGALLTSEEAMASVWIALQCASYLDQPSICFKYALALDRFLQSSSTGSDELSLSLLGAALSSHLQALKLCDSDLRGFATRYLDFGVKYKTSSEVLTAVAECLDTRCEEGVLMPEQRTALVLNLANSNRNLRLATLKVLGCCKPPDKDYSELVHDLMTIELDALDLHHCRRNCSMIERIKLRFGEGKEASLDHVDLVFQAMIGLLHNRLTLLCDPLVACLVTIVSNFRTAVQEDFLKYISAAQLCLGNNNVVDSGTMSTDGSVQLWRSRLGDTISSTPPATVMALLLRIAQQVPSFLSSSREQLMKLFLTFVSYKDKRSRGTCMNGNDWKALLKEWLILLEHFTDLQKGPHSFHLKQLLINSFLSYNDADIQKRTLACILKWKDPYLVAYKDQLNNLISSETFRDELLQWDLGRESENIKLEHRTELISVLVRVLYPKMTNKSGKSGSTNKRSTVLSFLSRVDASELQAFYLLILDPLKAGLRDSTKEIAFEEDLIERVDRKLVEKLPLKRKVGFLHFITDLLDAFSAAHIEPYLQALLAFVLRILQSASVDYDCGVDDNRREDYGPDDDGDELDDHAKKLKGEDMKKVAFGRKQLRPLCQRFISSLLNKFRNIHMEASYWEIFFSASEHSIANMKDENASSKQPSGLVQCLVPMSRSPDLAPLLQHTGVLSNVISILELKSLSPSVLSSVLEILENVLASGAKQVELLLLPWFPAILSGLSEQLSRNIKPFLKRLLSILSGLCEFVQDPTQLGGFLNVLLSFLKPKKSLDPDVCQSVLRIAISTSSAFDSVTALRCCDALGPLLASVSSQEVRTSACQLLEKLALADNSLLPVVQIIQDLNAMSTSVIGEYDYERRQRAFGNMNQEFFSLCTSKQAVLLMSQLVYDLQSDDMRYNASGCLLSLVRAVREDSLQQDVKGVVQEFAFAQFRSSVKSEKAALRMEWLLIFRELATCSNLPKIMEFRCLTSTDAEVNFFSNIVHVQVHRRVKAMSRFRALCSKGQFSQELLAKVFAPLFLHSLFEARGTNDGSIDAAILTLGNIAGSLQWTQWFKFLLRCFRLLVSKAAHQKPLVRLICVVLDSVHISTTRTSMEGAKVSNELQRKVLPELEKLMLTEKNEKQSVNVPIATAVTKVMKLLADDVKERELPRILQTITNRLKNRLQDTRDEARSALVSMAEVLGPSYLGLILKILQASLKRGYERHVLGFTVNAILIRLSTNLQVGDIDYCAEDLVAIISDEVFGEVSEEKEVEALMKKMKERKQARAFDNLKLLAQFATFSSTTLLLEPAKQREVSTKTKEKLQAYLSSIATGIQANSSCTAQKLVSFVSDILGEFLKLEDARAQGSSEAASDANMHLHCEFALQLLHYSLKENQLQAATELTTVLDSSIGLLHRCLSVKYEGVICGALRCLCFLSRLPLPSMDTTGVEIFSATCTLARSSSNAEKPLIQACLKLLVEALRHWKTLQLSDDQVRSLLELPVFIEIEAAQVLSLLKAVVDRKLLVPEVYDLMQRVQRLMITSQASAVQKRCSEVLLQFLLDYPLGPKRLQQHIEFLLSNMGYDHITGREAALEMLYTVISKFPEPVLQEYADSLFLTLVMKLANEKAEQVSVMLQTAIKVLLRRIDAQIMQRVTDFVLLWILGDKKALWSPAAQVASLLIEVMEKKFEAHLRRFLPALLKHLDSKNTDWKVVCDSLRAVEKLTASFPDQLYQNQEVWKLASEFLLHEQIAVMRTSARLFTLYLEGNRRSKLFTEAGSLAMSFCEQLFAKDLDEDFGEQVTKNINLLAPLLDASALAEVIKKMGRLALSFRDVQTRCVFKCYVCLIRELGAERVSPHLECMMGPLLRIRNATEASDKLKTLANEVRNDVRTLVGAEQYALVYNSVNQAMKARKEKRKREQSIAALLDPEKSARKKIRLGLKKREHKKRKREQS